MHDTNRCACFSCAVRSCPSCTSTWTPQSCRRSWGAPAKMPSSPPLLVNFLYHYLTISCGCCTLAGLRLCCSTPPVSSMLTLRPRCFQLRRARLAGFVPPSIQMMDAEIERRAARVAQATGDSEVTLGQGCAAEARPLQALSLGGSIDWCAMPRVLTVQCTHAY